MEFTGIEHAVTVRTLKQLLSALHDDDVLVVNQVRNFTIFRNDVYIGWVDLLHTDPSVDLSVGDHEIDRPTTSPV